MKLFFAAYERPAEAPANSKKQREERGDVNNSLEQFCSQVRLRTHALAWQLFNAIYQDQAGAHACI